MIAAVKARPQLLGILCILIGMVVLSLQDTVIKWISGRYPLHEIVLGRALVAIVLTALMAHFEGGLGLLKTKRPLLHMGRGMLLVVANMSYFLALAALPLAEAAAIFFVAPLFITVLSVPILGEKVGPWRWAAVVVGLGGVVVILRPGSGLLELAALLPLLAAFCYASMQMITRRLGVTDRASSMAFYIQLCFVLASGAIGLAVGDGRYATGAAGHPSTEFLLRAWSWPTLGDGLLIFSCGVMVAIGAYMLSQAYRIAEANLVAPFEYVALPMALLWGFVFWDHIPDALVWLGIALIMGSGLFIFYRETRQGRLVATEHPLPDNR